ncbi:tyrosine-type recombinase/integrase [Bacillus wiedmannii]|uniref:tyrosine-type recombinase/integrase n=1 Tax=Bacillus wiedmannii TaxID=1890302 RepID=UPI001156C58F|nr:tyrosine-type recombinase/integrase [Bacillus wiedmannii]
MKRIVDPVIYENYVSSDNKNLIRDFLIEKKAQGKAKSTLKQYEWDLRIILFLIYQHYDNKKLTELTRKDIRNLCIVFQEMDMSNARVNGLMSALRSSLEFCADDDDYEYEFNIGSRVKGLPKNPVREITFLKEEQIEWLLDELEKKNQTLIAVYLAISYYSAARKNEVYQVLKEGLEERYYTNTVVGKRSKKFRLYYNERTRNLISKYLEGRGEDSINQLFVKAYRNGEKRVVNKSTFNYWCDILSGMLSKREGKVIAINPHAFRHSRLDNLREQGIPLEKLKSLANHSDVSTTESYLSDRSENDIADIFGMDVSCFK